MRRSLRVLIALLVALALVAAAPVRAPAVVQDSVEESARRVSTLAAIRDSLVGRRAGAERAWLERLAVVALEAGLEGGVAAAAAMAAGDPQVDALGARLAQLDAWIGELGALIDSEDGAVAVALVEGERVGPLPPAVERWRPLVEAVFAPSRVNEALVVIACESRGDPEARNRRTGAAGLFQFLRGTWRHAAANAGVEGSSPYDPEANIMAAAWLVAASEAGGSGPWAHWSCRP